MTIPGQDLHVYEIIGEAVFRSSGTNSPMLLCKLVRTRVAFVKPIANGFRVAIADIASGYQDCWLPSWFSDWTIEDNIHGDDLQSGRPVDIAIEVQDFRGILTDKLPRDIVAVRVNDRWVLAKRFIAIDETST